MTAFPLAIIGFAADGTIRAFTAPSIMFIGLISALAHKEWRFIIYTVPVFNVAAARGLRIL
jgi:alpha-1,6-mannosyltransferase